MMIAFRVFLSGRMFSKDDWIRFYTKNQHFETICHNCKTVQDIKQYLRSIKERRTVDGVHAEFFVEKTGRSRKEHLLYKEIFKEQMTGASKAILFKWLQISRSRLLHKIEDPSTAEAKYLPEEDYTKMQDMLDESSSKGSNNPL